MTDLSERDRLIQSFDCYHEFIFFDIFVEKSFRIFLIGNKVAIIQVSDDLIKDSENLGGKVNELIVKLTIKLFYVSSLHNKYVSFIQVKSTKLCVIDFFGDGLSVNLGSNLEVDYKSFEIRVNLFGANIGSINHSSSFGCVDVGIVIRESVRSALISVM